MFLDIHKKIAFKSVPQYYYHQTFRIVMYNIIVIQTSTRTVYNQLNFVPVVPWWCILYKVPVKCAGGCCLNIVTIS